MAKQDGKAAREIEASTPVEEALEILRTQGSALCRQAIDPDKLRQLGENAQRFFGYAEFCLINKIEISQAQLYNFSAQRMSANFLAMIPRPQPVALPVLGLIRDSYLRPILTAWLKTEQALFLLHKSRVRKTYGPGHALNNAVKSLFPYHQDANGVSDKVDSLHCWVPLTPCGGSAPGVEVPLRPMSRVLPLKNDPESIYREFELVNADIAAATDGVPTQTAVYELGDVHLLPSKTLYRGWAEEGMTGASIAAEVRFAAESTAAEFPQEKKKILI